MDMNRFMVLLLCVAVFFVVGNVDAYPMDGYAETGIRRLERVRLIQAGEIQGPKLTVGAHKLLSYVKLNLEDRADSLQKLPAVDADLQKKLEGLFPDRHESYSISLMEITPGRPVRYAAYQSERLFSPGSVGKLVIVAGLFSELKRLYPDDVEKRRDLLRNRMVTAGKWVVGGHHEVPIYNVEDRSFVSRAIHEGDVFSLYEWTDHMMSASANSAASTVWKEVMLMRAFGTAYPPSEEVEEAFWKTTAKSELRAMGLSVVNDPLRTIGIAKGDWQLGSFFTSYGQRVVQGAGSFANPRGMIMFLMRLEQGLVVDAWSSLEIKRLMYMTAKRIRYASSYGIARSAIYFKSGSLYKCKPEPDFKCKKYMGNVENAMNSVAIVERSNGQVYLVALMSNVLRKNSAEDHQALATEIDRILGD
ncbi:MAG: hypothetical protein ACI8V2_005220 [Candidatus Latescibacterota bacterium]|jgi:hypothetical protein